MSTDQDSFLQSIINHPDDDDHRLIYADWLSERGDPRGEFIRIQCERAAMPDYDLRQLDLAEREQELLTEYRELWTRPLEPFATDFKFSRGFVHSATIDGAHFANTMRNLRQHTPLTDARLLLGPRTARVVRDLRELDQLRGLTIVGAEQTMTGHVLLDFFDSMYLTHLRRLDLTGAVAVAFALAAVPRGRLRSLRELKVDQDALQFHPGLIQSPLAKQLEILDLHHGAINDHRFSQIMLQTADLENRRRLSIATDDENDVLELLERTRLPHLQDLAIMGQVDSPFFSRIFSKPSFPLLRRLRLFIGKSQRFPIEALIGSQTLFGLESLDLASDLPLSDFRTLMQTPWFQRLKRLRLYYQRFDDATIAALAAAPTLAAMDSLNLEGRQITTLRPIAESNYFRETHGLSIRRTSAGEDDFVSLLNSPGMSSVRQLSIHDSRLGGAGLRALARSGQLSKLRGLSLTDIEAPSAAWRGLFETTASEFPKLERVTLQRNRFSEDTLVELMSWPILEKLEVLSIEEPRSKQLARTLRRRMPRRVHLA